eukprot:CAMPEP_0118820918 /NCGR_PEP_ID=MMETSP1162-20130426/8075_1 /TAXON_ID=33656 /ORGANISM="Phaeocystis Sp, Strain CCMP2710" /LENGTH=88 /DNA_ID=CAMNT_0006751347 /DNA_START=222 /DNA_END=489 /DNA_ORIENTATION=+
MVTVTAMATAMRRRDGFPAPRGGFRAQAAEEGSVPHPWAIRTRVNSAPLLRLARAVLHGHPMAASHRQCRSKSGPGRAAACVRRAWGH